MKVTAHRPETVKPPPDRVTIELSWNEVGLFRSILGRAIKNPDGGLRSVTDFARDLNDDIYRAVY